MGIVGSGTSELWPYMSLGCRLSEQMGAGFLHNLERVKPLNFDSSAVQRFVTLFKITGLMHLVFLLSSG